MNKQTQTKTLPSFFGGCDNKIVVYAGSQTLSKGGLTPPGLRRGPPLIQWGSWGVL